MQILAHAGSPRDRRPAVGQITLICRNAETTATFYRQGLGAALVVERADAHEPLMLRLPGGGPLLALRSAAPGAAPSGPADIELEIWVGDVDLIWRTLKDSDFSGLSEVSDSPRGRVFSVPDPDGRLLHVYAQGA
jgi:catechol 2,3-dioxygenase-like lactoylglutathione lyase family enzyme